MQPLLHDLYRSTEPPPRANLVRLILAVGVVVVAYHVSLLTLLDGLRLDVPTAHLALVLPIGCVLAYVHRRPQNDTAIHDRQIDWIVGLPLVAIAVAMNVYLPDQLSSDYWALRFDLLSLPFFVAGVVTLLFGVRVLGRQRRAIGYLFLAWPWPYNTAIDRWLDRFTDATISSLSWMNRVVQVASQGEPDPSLFRVPHRGTGVTLSVASACSGANGVVGFMIVGVALLLVVHGSRKAKIAWLAAGALLVWLFNLARIYFVFLAVRWWGPNVAIDGLHPVVGLIGFIAAMTVMLLTMRRFGITYRTDAYAWAMPAISPNKPRISGAACCILIAAGGLGWLNTDLRDASQITDPWGSPKLAAFDDVRVEPVGWDLGLLQDIEWAKRFFGRDSTWRRYAYTASGDMAPAVDTPLYADIITTTDRSALQAYGVVACYRFHNYRITTNRRADVGFGVVANVLTWTAKNDATWTTVSWQWRVASGDGTAYERTTLILSNDALTSESPAPETDLVPAADPASKVGATSPEVTAAAWTEKTLIAFAQELVRARVHPT